VCAGHFISYVVAPIVYYDRQFFRHFAVSQHYFFVMQTAQNANLALQTAEIN
jgi:hypothetical protein